MGELWRKHSEAAEGTIDMKPEFVSVGDAPRTPEIVEGACIDRACRSDDHEGCKAGCSVSANHLLEGHEVDTIGGVAGDSVKLIGTQPQKLEGLLYRIVRLFRTIADECRLVLHHPLAAHSLRSNPLAGDGKAE